MKIVKLILVNNLSLYLIELNKKNQEIEETRKALILSMGQNLELYPSISVNGPCKINLNVGGMQFRMNQKELK